MWKLKNSIPECHGQKEQGGETCYTAMFSGRGVEGNEGRKAGFGNYRTCGIEKRRRGEMERLMSDVEMLAQRKIGRGTLRQNQKLREL